MADKAQTLALLFFQNVYPLKLEEYLEKLLLQQQFYREVLLRIYGVSQSQYFLFQHSILWLNILQEKSSFSNSAFVKPLNPKSSNSLITEI